MTVSLFYATADDVIDKLNDKDFGFTTTRLESEQFHRSTDLES